MLIFLFCSLYSQEGFGTLPTISIKSNALIYSSDSNFNKQFTSNESTDYEISNSGEGIVFKVKDKAAARDIAKIKSKATIQHIDHTNSKKLRQTLSDFEKRKRLFDFCNINGSPFSHQTPYSSRSNRNYIVPSRTTKDFLKINIFQYHDMISLVLEFLYVWKYHYFNNKPIDLCFSEVFSVRPPPLFVV